jgi:hypothetical protein
MLETINGIDLALFLMLVVTGTLALVFWHDSRSAYQRGYDEGFTAGEGVAPSANLLRVIPHRNAVRDRPFDWEEDGL